MEDNKFYYHLQDESQDIDRVVHDLVDMTKYPEDEDNDGKYVKIEEDNGELHFVPGDGGSSAPDTINADENQIVIGDGNSWATGGESQGDKVFLQDHRFGPEINGGSFTITSNPRTKMKEKENEDDPDEEVDNFSLTIGGKSLTAIDGTTRFTMHDDSKMDITGGINRPDAGAEIYVHGDNLFVVDDQIYGTPTSASELPYAPQYIFKDIYYFNNEADTSTLAFQFYGSNGETVSTSWTDIGDSYVKMLKFNDNYLTDLIMTTLQTVPDFDIYLSQLKNGTLKAFRVYYNQGSGTLRIEPYHDDYDHWYESEWQNPEFDYYKWSSSSGDQLYETGTSAPHGRNNYYYDTPSGNKESDNDKKIYQYSMVFCSISSVHEAYQTYWDGTTRQTGGPFSITRQQVTASFESDGNPIENDNLNNCQTDIDEEWSSQGRKYTINQLVFSFIDVVENYNIIINGQQYKSPQKLMRADSKIKPHVELIGEPRVRFIDSSDVLVENKAQMQLKQNSILNLDNDVNIRFIQNADVCLEDNAKVSMKENASVTMEGDLNMRCVDSISTMSRATVHIEGNKDEIYHGDKGDTYPVRINIADFADIIATRNAHVKLTDNALFEMQADGWLQLYDASSLKMFGNSQIVMQSKDEQHSPVIRMNPDSLEIVCDAGVGKHLINTDNAFGINDDKGNKIADADPTSPSIRVAGKALIQVEGKGKANIQVRQDEGQETQVFYMNDAFDHHSGKTHFEIHDESIMLIRGPQKPLYERPYYEKTHLNKDWNDEYLDRNIEGPLTEILDYSVLRLKGNSEDQNYPTYKTTFTINDENQYDYWEDARDAAHHATDLTYNELMSNSYTVKDEVKKEILSKFKDFYQFDDTNANNAITSVDAIIISAYDSALSKYQYHFQKKYSLLLYTKPYLSDVQGIDNTIDIISNCDYDLSNSSDIAALEQSEELNNAMSEIVKDHHGFIDSSYSFTSKDITYGTNPILYTEFNLLNEQAKIGYCYYGNRDNITYTQKAIRFEHLSVAAGDRLKVEYVMKDSSNIAPSYISLYIYGYVGDGNSGTECSKQDDYYIVPAGCDNIDISIHYRDSYGGIILSKEEFATLKVINTSQTTPVIIPEIPASTWTYYPMSKSYSASTIYLTSGSSTYKTWHNVMCKDSVVPSGYQYNDSNIWVADNKTLAFNGKDISILSSPSIYDVKITASLRNAYVSKTVYYALYSVSSNDYTPISGWKPITTVTSLAHSNIARSSKMGILIRVGTSSYRDDCVDITNPTSVFSSLAFNLMTYPNHNNYYHCYYRSGSNGEEYYFLNRPSEYKDSLVGYRVYLECYNQADVDKFRVRSNENTAWIKASQTDKVLCYPAQSTDRFYVKEIDADEPDFSKIRDIVVEIVTYNAEKEPISYSYSADVTSVLKARSDSVVHRQGLDYPIFEMIGSPEFRMNDSGITFKDSTDSLTVSVQDLKSVVNGNALNPSAYNAVSIHANATDKVESIESGGYIRIGNLAFVSVRLRTRDQINPGLAVIQGCPRAYGTLSGIGNSYVAVTSNIGGNWTLTNAGNIIYLNSNSAAIPANTMIILTCAYLCE